MSETPYPSEKRDFDRPIKNASKITRSGQNFPRPTFFEVPFPSHLVVKVDRKTYCEAVTVTKQLKRTRSGYRGQYPPVPYFGEEVNLFD